MVTNFWPLESLSIFFSISSKIGQFFRACLNHVPFSISKYCLCESFQNMRECSFKLTGDWMGIYFHIAQSNIDIRCVVEYDCNRFGGGIFCGRGLLLIVVV